MAAKVTEKNQRLEGGGNNVYANIYSFFLKLLSVFKSNYRKFSLCYPSCCWLISRSPPFKIHQIYYCYSLVYQPPTLFILKSFTNNSLTIPLSLPVYVFYVWIRETLNKFRYFIIKNNKIKKKKKISSSSSR